MAKTIKVSIRCLHCGKEFPSPIGYGDSETFDTAQVYGNTVTCPYCGKMTGCNKENTRIKFEEGGFIGNKT
jgi:DNA-directed RNA polymerase subunit RPC12/RpoP